MTESVLTAVVWVPDHEIDRGLELTAGEQLHQVDLELIIGFSITRL